MWTLCVRVCVCESVCGGVFFSSFLCACHAGHSKESVNNMFFHCPESASVPFRSHKTRESRSWASFPKCEMTFFFFFYLSDQTKWFGARAIRPPLTAQDPALGRLPIERLCHYGRPAGPAEPGRQTALRTHLTT